MRLVNWNILAGGGEWVAGIVQRIAHHAPDICVLSEYRSGVVGGILKARMLNIGFEFHGDTEPLPQRNSVCIFSRSPLSIAPIPPVPSQIQQHLICRMAEGVVLIGAFCATPAIAKQVLNYLVTLPSALSELSIIATGDFFFGIRASNPRFYRPLDSLRAAGWVDMWRLGHGSETGWSFQSGRGKSQPDHIFCYGPISSRLKSVEFSKMELESKISDHSPMIAQFDF